ncbi:orotidine-5'-phosphate decarboxylase [Ferrithrix thermotolerans DSM 19514]|uniref:Orotidine 5'-phosphate decarboxylase n=1 Tax=Ferrithrix thermotolerans DSM 19514 TaxID=1121881 RepID=A0A1M4T6J7_9ACTN|nr:orotidine-5'-phosphate decarboxylase [Ferrithrix thermotolerans]SHE40162.1 orotidine-5'-phosphate decarboxylase [Ferrithrix thermotolerans DSM 19514]
MSQAEQRARDHLALALDFDDLVVASRLARSMTSYFSTVKVGLELFSATGPESVAVFLNLGYKVFLDLKLHDIPTTVGKAAKVLGGLGASYLTLHAFGGVDMLRAGVEGLAEGAGETGAAIPKALAVTVLTSDAEAPEHVMPKRLELAVQSGCQGYVCAAVDLPLARSLAPDLFAAVPGIRPKGADRHDQKRASTPQEAILNGADLLVVGRPVTLSSDPMAAAEEIFSSIL